MSNKVLITNSQKAVKVPSGLRILIRRACNAVLEYEHFDRPAEISVTFVDNAAIAELNNQYRNKPMPTDYFLPTNRVEPCSISRLASLGAINLPVVVSISSTRS